MSIFKNCFISLIHWQYQQTTSSHIIFIIMLFWVFAFIDNLATAKKILQNKYFILIYSL